MNHSHDKRTNLLIVDQPFDADGNETPFGQRWGGERFTLTPDTWPPCKRARPLRWM
jgi:hypothetical protein